MEEANNATQEINQVKVKKGKKINKKIVVILGVVVLICIAILVVIVLHSSNSKKLNYPTTNFKNQYYSFQYPKDFKITDQSPDYVEVDSPNDKNIKLLLKAFSKDIYGEFEINEQSCYRGGLAEILYFNTHGDSLAAAEGSEIVKINSKDSCLIKNRSSDENKKIVHGYQYQIPNPGKDRKQFLITIIGPDIKSEDFKKLINVAESFEVY